MLLIYGDKDTRKISITLYINAFYDITIASLTIVVYKTAPYLMTISSVKTNRQRLNA